ncbi:GNAT family N-acetyltransferase [Mesorhizobium sp. IMUNJ 23232]|uniref:GNAT family N-acetyltransferase n=1 Tax=Mesorhizobium sp. IMUNJ 23232 TaxID=3376064 RepID=UPI00379D63B5
MSITTRSATSTDASHIDRLLRALAEFEGVTADLTFTLADLERALSESGQFHAVVAESDDQIAGCVTYTWDFAIWSGGPILRVDDLVVDERYRGLGVGTALMQALAERALERGANMRWEVEPNNENALKFYARLGVSLRNKIVARWSPTKG